MSDSQNCRLCQQAGLPDRRVQSSWASIYVFCPVALTFLLPKVAQLAAKNSNSCKDASLGSSKRRESLLAWAQSQSLCAAFSLHGASTASLALRSRPVVLSPWPQSEFALAAPVRFKRDSQSELCFSWPSTTIAISLSVPVLRYCQECP